MKKRMDEAIATAERAASVCDIELLLEQSCFLKVIEGILEPSELAHLKQAKKKMVAIVKNLKCGEGWEEWGKSYGDIPLQRGT